MKYVGDAAGAQTAVPAGARGWEGRRDASACEFVVKELSLCPAGGTRCSSMGPKGLNSGVGLQERCDARFLRFLPNCDFWFLLIPFSLCP